MLLHVFLDCCSISAAIKQVPFAFFLNEIHKERRVCKGCGVSRCGVGSTIRSLNIVQIVGCQELLQPSR